LVRIAMPSGSTSSVTRTRYDTGGGQRAEGRAGPQTC
jgi:hypothetical protein